MPSPRPLARHLAHALVRPTARRRRGAGLVTLGALLALCPAPAAAYNYSNQTPGHGTVSFQFLSFVGPFARATAADQSNPAGWNSVGLVNGMMPGATGFATGGPGALGQMGYVTGSLALGATPTNSVSLRYDGVLPGLGDENVISFAPRNFITFNARSFVLGTLTFKNGAWLGSGTTAAYDVETVLGFRITTTSDFGSPAGYDHTIEGTIRLRVSSPQGIDRSTLAGKQAEADWIYIDSPAVIANGATTTNALRVYERGYDPTGAGSTGSVDLVGQFNSLDLMGLENAEGGFLTESVDALSAVPEPSTWALLGTGLLAVAGVARRRRVG